MMASRDNTNRRKKPVADVISEQRTIIIALMFVVLGLVFLFAPGLRPEFRTLGIALIPAGVITTVTEFSLRRDLVRELRESTTRYDRFCELERLGIKNVFENRRSDDPIFGCIASTAKTAPRTLTKVQLLGLSLEPFMHIVGDYMNDLLSMGCEFEFLSLDAECQVAQTRMMDQDQPALCDRIRVFDAWLLQQRGKPRSAGRIEVRKYSLMPTVHITILNDERMFVNPYPVLGASWDFPVMEISKGGKLFDKYKGQFQALWDKADRPDEPQRP